MYIKGQSLDLLHLYIALLHLTSVGKRYASSIDEWKGKAEKGKKELAREWMTGIRLP